METKTDGSVECSPYKCDPEVNFWCDKHGAEKVAAATSQVDECPDCGCGCTVP